MSVTHAKQIKRLVFNEKDKATASDPLWDEIITKGEKDLSTPSPCVIQVYFCECFLSLRKYFFSQLDRHFGEAACIHCARNDGMICFTRRDVSHRCVCGDTATDECFMRQISTNEEKIVQWMRVIQYQLTQCLGWSHFNWFCGVLDKHLFHTTSHLH